MCRLGNRLIYPSPMTPAKAAALQARESAVGGIIVWYVTLSAPEHPGKAVAFARVGDHSGGHRLPLRYGKAPSRGSSCANSSSQQGAFQLTRRRRAATRPITPTPSRAREAGSGTAVASKLTNR